MWLGWGLKRIPPPLGVPDSLQRPLMQPPRPPRPPAGWVHPGVDTVGSSEEPRLWKEIERGRLAGSRNMVSPEVLICDLYFARNGDFFSFQKAVDFLEF